MAEIDKNKFFVRPDDYETLRFGGESVQNKEHGRKMMMKYYQHLGLTEDNLKEINQKYNLDTIFQMVKLYFKEEYGYQCEEIELSNRYQHSINSYVRLDEKRTNFIHIDELLESSIMSFFMIILKWSKEMDDLETYRNCFNYLLFIINDISILGDIPNENSKEMLLRIIKEDIQITNLASDCYWTTVVFSLAHEVAHAYFQSIGKIYIKTAEEEFAADAIAYDIVLKIIIDQSCLTERDKILEEYTYLAPIMYMKFFDLFYYTDNVLYNKQIIDITHPFPEDRIRHLFEIVNDDKYDFDTIKGNDLYNGFLDAYDEYKMQLKWKKEHGKLDRIIQKKERERREKRNG